MGCFTVLPNARLLLIAERCLAGGGATVINDNIDRHSPGNVIEEHPSHDQHKSACCEGIHAAHGGAGGPSEHEVAPSMGVSYPSLISILCKSQKSGEVSGVFLMLMLST